MAHKKGELGEGRGKKNAVILSSNYQGAEKGQIRLNADPRERIRLLSSRCEERRFMGRGKKREGGEKLSPA